MEEHIASTFVFLENAKKGDLSLGAYYAKFRGICEELNICEPISSDIQVARFISGASSTYDPVSPQLLGSRDLPSLSEVFSRLRQSFVSVSTPAPSLDRLALAFAVFGSFGSSFSRGRGRGHDSGFTDCGRDSGFSGCGFGQGVDGCDSGFGVHGGRMSGGGGHGRDCDSKLCTYC
ncbi:uncharacterized protein LOC131318807 isoform X2 [Rhododendron vialii]|uniref:uncharacterized protein LOC131318807 isoform X2 n=1 Tax=Rhododendron vialii TaxID=182163 RepID=UPI00265D6F43|nr:uncharacterized protein LOC131318807 isoform X2 [Rhododendron vialii]